MKRAFKILRVFVFAGVPIGISLFWIGLNVLYSYNQSSSILNGIAAGSISLPIVVFFGSLVGVPLAILNALVFIILTRTKLGKINIIVTGMFSGTLILLIILSASFLYHIVYLGMEITNSDLRFPFQLWLIFSSCITGAIVGKILKSDFKQGVNAENNK